MLDGPPNRQRPGLVRTWGDGATDRRAHVIEDISFGDTPYVYCRCGETILSGEHTLEQAWDLHRGLTTGYALRFGVPASDDEVDDFLDKIAQPNRKGEPRAPRAPLHHTAPAGDDGSAEQVSLLLDRLRIMGERCTCDTTPVERCPNYVEGDEHDND